jgi:hypothetical protein
METTISFAGSKEPAAAPYLKWDESIAYDSILFLCHPFYAVLPSTLESLKRFQIFH